MVALSTVQSQNTEIKKLGPGLVGVFVGATSGIGESTAREFVRHALKPRVYLVGRNEAQASSIIEELRALNPESETKFIKSDVSLLKNVDQVCEEIKSEEERINLLVLTQGIMTTKGRDETEEGLDKKFSLHYYSRMRFIHNLQPLLSRAATSPLPGVSPLSRVLSVLGPGHEGQLDLSDLSLRNPGSFSLRTCANHAITMNSLAVAHLASLHPETSFIHAAPGAVPTNLARDMNIFLKGAAEALLKVAGPFIGTSVKESGERHAWAATTMVFPSRSEGRTGKEVAVGTTGERGTGAYLVDSRGNRSGAEKVLGKYWGDGMVEKVWDHTLDVFEKICGAGGKGRYDG